MQPTDRQLITPTPAPRRGRRRARPFALLGVLLGAIALAGCGGGGEKAKPASAAAATPTTAAAPAAGAATVKISGFAFSPADIEVKAGDEIEWTNADSAAHTVTATSGADFDSGTLAQGASFAFKAAKPGTIAYICSIHPSMKGTITVR